MAVNNEIGSTNKPEEQKISNYPPSKTLHRIWTFIRPISEKDLPYGTDIIIQIERQTLSKHHVYTVILQYQELYIELCKMRRQNLLSKELRDLQLNEKILFVSQDGKIQKSQIYWDIVKREKYSGNVITFLNKVKRQPIDHMPFSNL